MSRRKHVTADLNLEIEAPKDGQQIVRAKGTRGGNIVEIEYPSGTLSLALMPARFIKKLWVRKGGYLMVEHSEEAGGESKVTATILAVLYDAQIKTLKQLGAWPPEFSLQEGSTAGPAASGLPADCLPPSDDEDDEDDGLPPLEQNNNRRVVYHDVSDSDDSDADS